MYNINNNNNLIEIKELHCFPHNLSPFKIDKIYKIDLSPFSRTKRCVKHFST